MENIEKIIKDSEKYAKENKIFLNPNRKIVKSLARGLAEREKKFGARYCPCRRITGDKEKDKKIICPCVYSSQELQNQGRCFCGLFIK